MSHAQEHPVRCARQPDGCTASIPGSKSHQIRAAEQGWFFQQNGDAWCPEHTPEWVAEWRARTPARERSRW